MTEILRKLRKSDRIISPMKLVTEAKGWDSPRFKTIGKTITIPFLFPGYATRDHSLRPLLHRL